MERRTPWLGYLCVILSAVIFGCMPLGANFLYAQGVTPMSLVFLRNLLSLPVLALLCQKQGGLRISRGALLETSLTGFFGCCITPILLFSSYCYLASGMATVFHFAYPVIVVLGGLVLRERVQKKALFCAILCSLGILLLIDPSGAVDPARCRAGADVRRDLRRLHSAFSAFPPPRGHGLSYDLLHGAHQCGLHVLSLSLLAPALPAADPRRMARGARLFADDLHRRGHALPEGHVPHRRTARSDFEYV